MSSMTTLLFPGQGSQYKGMGENLFDQFPHETQLASELLGYCIKTLCLQDRENQLNHTRYTQPALYVVNALTFYRRLQNNQTFDYAVGHSLGEYNALLSANVFDFATGLRLVQKRGELMAQAQGGAMAAVIGMTYNQIENLLQEYQLLTITIANYNSYRQLVISGPATDIEKAKTIFATYKRVMFLPLKVSGAFHSFHMHPAEQAYEKFLETITFHSPSVPVIANCNANFYHPAVIRKNLAQHLSHPVQWSKTIEYLFAQGEVNFEELGPGNILMGLVRKIRDNE